MPSLSLKASINCPFIGGSAGPAPYVWIDPDGQDWYTRVVSSGGSITNANQAAFDTAFQALKSTNGNDGNSLWSHVNQGYWFIGQESLTNGLMVPFYRSDVSGGSAVWGQNATNNNFSNYTKTGGLVGDGASTSVQTTINNNNDTNWSVFSRMGYVYLSNASFAEFKRFHPYGSSSVPRAFSFAADGSQFAGLALRLRLNSGTSNNFTVSQCDDGGWGLIARSGIGTQTVVCGTGMNYVISLGSASTASLANSSMKIGNSSLGFSECNIKCAIFGEGWPGYEPFETNAFGIIDGIVNTLVASLT